MADETSAFVIPLHQVPRKRKDKAGADRAKAPRPRKKRKAPAVAAAAAAAAAVAAAEPEIQFPESLIPPEFLAADGAMAEPPAAQPLAVTVRQSEPVAPTQTVAASLIGPATPSHHRLAPAILSTAALTLGAVGITINGWFARSLGSSDVAGWLFLAVGVAADLVALVLPSCAASLWRSRQRSTALVGWTVWLLTFIFAVAASIGFTSTNITDVKLSRASRVTPAIASAQATLSDAMAARDRECKGGVGKFCRERETAVAERRQMLDSAMASVEAAADPQTEAAIKLVSWGSRGLLNPAPEDFAMLRLILLALLPQIGGILLMIGQRSRSRV
ncbi:MAG: hypothetical protein KGK16_00615 [Bradyrhizobium sp.]|nr:hypothetical protein [Bradyrhizobium sp.]